MSNFGVHSSKLKEARESISPKLLKLTTFFDPRQNWVLVPDGSFMGFFDWVPKHLRIGPWSPFSPIVLIAIGYGILLTKPNNLLLSFVGNDSDNHYSDVGAGAESIECASTNTTCSAAAAATLSVAIVELYSQHWWYNLINFIFMASMIIYLVTYRSIGVVVTYTILSWVFNCIRHGINTIAPLLLKLQHDQHGQNHQTYYQLILSILLRFNHLIRFPALVSATITFIVWNFILLPGIYLYAFEDMNNPDSNDDTKNNNYQNENGKKQANDTTQSVSSSAKKKRAFLKFNVSFRMVQIHVCNIIYAILNTITSYRIEGSSQQLQHTPQLFDSTDLWCGVTYGYMYGLFYTLVLDRIGVHLYPIFSPRTHFVIVTWIGVFGVHYIFYICWNEVIIHELDKSILSMEFLIPLNFILIGTFAIISYWFESKK
mmetsp:Transcript_5396/g.5925  ORF Transcript_5396/g.5925 Transcript_5396/m.5925 type:complete len:429 (+) Transcript_5396:602-1888(+)